MSTSTPREDIYKRIADAQTKIAFVYYNWRTLNAYCFLVIFRMWIDWEEIQFGPDRSLSQAQMMDLIVKALECWPDVMAKLVSGRKAGQAVDFKVVSTVPELVRASFYNAVLDIAMSHSYCDSATKYLDYHNFANSNLPRSMKKIKVKSGGKASQKAAKEMAEEPAAFSKCLKLFKKNSSDYHFVQMVPFSAVRLIHDALCDEKFFYYHYGKVCSIIFPRVCKD